MSATIKEQKEELTNLLNHDAAGAKVTGCIHITRAKLFFSFLSQNYFHRFLRNSFVEFFLSLLYRFIFTIKTVPLAMMSN